MCSCSSFFFFYVYGYHLDLHVLTHPFPTRRSSALPASTPSSARRPISSPIPTARSARRCAGMSPRQASPPPSASTPVPPERSPTIWPCRASRSTRHTARPTGRSEEHTSELQSLMRISHDVYCLRKIKYNNHLTNNVQSSL